MDSKCVLYLLICVLKLICCWGQSDDVFPSSTLENEFLDTVTTTEDNTCTTRLHSCSIKGPVIAKTLIGEKGEKGSMGNKGERGLRGLPGTPGLPGAARNFDPTDDGEFTDASTIGSKVKPLTKLCNDYEDLSDDAEYWIRKHSPFKIKCLKTGWTCLTERKNTTEFSYAPNTEPFWLSELGFSIHDLYGLSIDQILYLQERASSVKVAIRYHCRNSFVLTNDTNKDLRVLTWNDVVIGPYPRPETPLYYSISTDTCTVTVPDDNSKWLYTDISLVSDQVRRLPVIDFHIRDVRKENQTLFLELIDLCFN